MPATPISHAPSSILAVVVVYNCEFSQSHSVSSLFQILSENPELAKHFSVVLYDNSPQPQSPVSPPDFPTHYVHDPSNGGLATAYNFALARAESEEREWLLLLDQDTTLTREFISELVETAETLRTRPEVASFWSPHPGQGLISPMERGRRVESLACRHRFCPVYHGRR
jgi:GT2 family glycosyltransferase